MANLSSIVTSGTTPSWAIPNIYDTIETESLNANATISKRTTIITGGTSFTLQSFPTKGNKRTIINCSNNEITITSTIAIGNLASGNPTSIKLKFQEWLDIVSDGTLWRVI